LLYISFLHLIFYCRPDNFCFPFTVQFRENKGRVLVASRDIEPLELIMWDEAAALGPRKFQHLYVIFFMYYIKLIIQNVRVCCMFKLFEAMACETKKNSLTETIYEFFNRMVNFVKHVIGQFAMKNVRKVLLTKLNVKY